MNYSIRKIPATVACLSAALLLAGCASTKVSDQVHNVSVDEKLPKPAHIWVYSFADTSAEVPEQSALTGRDTTAQTDDEIEQGHLIGASIAEQLAEKIQKLGLPGVHAADDSKPAVNDIVIRGYLLTIDEGSAAKRLTLGFGSGSSSLEVAVEGYQMTVAGLRKLGSATLDSGGSKTPGAAVGVAAFIATANPVGLIVSGGSKIYGEASGSAKIEGRTKATADEIAEQLEKRFKQQGWID